MVQIPATNYTVNETNGITIPCHTTGNPTPVVTWIKKGMASAFSNGNTLSFSNITRQEAGTFFCQAVNILGVANASVYVKIQCK